MSIMSARSMKTLGDMAIRLNRPAVVIAGLQARFDLPTFPDADYSDAYLAFLRTLIYLRTLGIAEDRLLRLWHFERKLLQLLHVDSTGSETWFLDSCGAITRRDRRLLLSNYDIGIAVPSHALQLGLNFASTLPELFGGAEMGEDALRVLNDIIPLLHRRAQLSRAANERYLTALAAASDTTALAEEAARVCQPGRRQRAMNPLNKRDARLLQAVHDGRWLLKGFRNRDLRHSLFPPTADATKWYHCPMHLEMESTKPGKCPKCGMDYVPFKKK